MVFPRLIQNIQIQGSMGAFQQPARNYTDIVRCVNKIYLRFMVFAGYENSDEIIKSLAETCYCSMQVANGMRPYQSMALYMLHSGAWHA